VIRPQLFMNKYDKSNVTSDKNSHFGVYTSFLSTNFHFMFYNHI